jgi:hypothetical protein
METQSLFYEEVTSLLDLLHEEWDNPESEKLHWPWPLYRQYLVERAALLKGLEDEDLPF